MPLFEIFYRGSVLQRATFRLKVRMALGTAFIARAGQPQ
jgi:hypothetical protein